MTTEASMRVVFRHALLLAVLKDDPNAAAAQLVSSVGGDRALLEEAHDHYQAVLRQDATDAEARRAVVLIEWALAATPDTLEGATAG